MSSILNLLYRDKRRSRPVPARPSRNARFRYSAIFVASPRNRGQAKCGIASIINSKPFSPVSFSLRFCALPLLKKALLKRSGMVFSAPAMERRKDEKERVFQ